MAHFESYEKKLNKENNKWENGKRLEIQRSHDKCNGYKNFKAENYDNKHKNPYQQYIITWTKQFNEANLTKSCAKLK